MLENLSGCSGVIAGTELYTIDLLKKLKKLKVISRLGVGIDNLPIDYINENGIKIYRSSKYLSESVAELTIGLIFNLLKKITFLNNKLKRGVWEKDYGNLLSGKTVGIVGMGNIGKKLAKMLKGFEIRLLANDLNPDVKYLKNLNAEFVSFDYLLRESDVVSIHLSLNEKTKNLFTYNEFKKMKKNSILINVSRGEIVNENDLVRSLNNKIINGAGVDVYTNEPYDGPLVNCENIIMTPHIASYSRESRLEMEIEAVKNILRGLDIEE